MHVSRAVPVACLWIAVQAAACFSVDVTPRTIAEARVPQTEREQALATWRAAVEVANGFLESPYRRTLPPGRFELDDDGMRFTTERGTWPIAVRWTTFGDVVIAFGYAAQEREEGFIVGARPPKTDVRIDNSFLRHGDGEPKDPDDVASLFLHETTHVVYREGTVGFWNGVAYYLEAVFLMRYADHSAERRPHATSQEFLFFVQSKELPESERATWFEQFELHLAQSTGERCIHAPPDAPPPPP